MTERLPIINMESRQQKQLDGASKMRVLPSKI